MTAFDSDYSFGTNRPHFLVVMSRLCSKFFLNRYFYLLLFCLASVMIVTENEVLGAFIFVTIICVALILCEDIMATVLPFLLLCVFITNCYDSYDIFMPYLWVAVPAVLAIVFHFVVYHRKMQIGNTFVGLIGISIALILGGCGVLSPEEYFAPGVLFYTLGLGIGMVVAYLLLKPQFCVDRGYNVKEKFISILYIMGMLAVVMVLFFITEHTQYIQDNKTLPDWQPSNNISTILMFALPCPFFYLYRNRIHLLSILTIYGAIILTGSRAGMLMGTIELFVCLFIAAIWDRGNRFTYVCIGIALIGLGYMFGPFIMEFTTRIDLSELITKDESRWQLMFRAKDLFLEHPIFGHGLGYQGNQDLYAPLKGAMSWYHMMIPQVVGSMGTIGILTYGFQFFLQTRCTVLSIFQTKEIEERGLILTLVCSYIGVLLMSQVNPGLFCPLPYAVLGVIIFALIDGDGGPWPLKLKQKTHASLESSEEASTEA